MRNLLRPGNVSNRDSFVIANADTILRALDEDTREMERLGCALLGTKMRDICLILGLISRVN